MKIHLNYKCYKTFWFLEAQYDKELEKILLGFMFMREIWRSLWIATAGNNVVLMGAIKATKWRRSWREEFGDGNAVGEDLKET